MESHQLHHIRNQYYPRQESDIQLYGSVTIDIGMIIDHFKGLGFKEFHIEEFHGMNCDRESFRPSPLERFAVKLGEHAPLYCDLELGRGIEISIDEAREILRKIYITVLLSMESLHQLPRDT